MPTTRRTENCYAQVKRAVSIYGWASLRYTFCRIAIECGVDEKMIMRTAGHINLKTTMTYYNNPTGVSSSLVEFLHVLANRSLPPLAVSPPRDR